MNNQMLSLIDRVRNTIALGESHFREFKSALAGPPSDKKPRPAKDICRDIAEALVGFANADGGELLVGVEDDGSVTGVMHAAADVELMVKAHKSHVHADSNLPVTHATRLTLDGRDIVFFAVSKGVTRVYQVSDGRCVRRRDKVTEPVDVQQLQYERHEAQSRAYDQQFVDGASVNDLDLQLVQSIADNYLHGMSVEHYLQQVGLAEYATTGLRLRQAALLLFARDVIRWHPRSQVRILKVRGNELKTGDAYNVAADELAQGNLFQLLQSSWDKLRPFLAYKTEFGQDSRFEQRYLYPESACREALINALAHRAYNNSRGVEVFVFDDRMEIKSPGGLLSTLSLDGLLRLGGAHESRNTLVARVLRENKYMRELGEGIRRIFEVMEKSELQKPRLASDETGFTIILPHRSVFTPQQEQWLKVLNAGELTGLQKKVLVLGMEGREVSRHDIIKALNTEDRDTYDQTITPLRKSGVLQEIRTNPEAARIAKAKRIPKDRVPRFRVVSSQGPAASPAVDQTAREPAAYRTPVSHGVEGATTGPTVRPARRTTDVRAAATDTTCSVFFRFQTSPEPLRREEVVELFGRCGRVKHIEMPKIPKSDVQRGFGFVYFATPVAAERAVRELRQATIGNRRVNVFARRSESAGADIEH